ncbi:MAG: hypothetical protein AB7S61_09525 [Methanoregulaceae archaeon]
MSRRLFGQHVGPAVKETGIVDGIARVDTTAEMMDGGVVFDIEFTNRGGHNCGCSG